MSIHARGVQPFIQLIGVIVVAVPGVGWDRRRRWVLAANRCDPEDHVRNVVIEKSPLFSVLPLLLLLLVMVSSVDVAAVIAAVFSLVVVGTAFFFPPCFVV